MNTDTQIKKTTTNKKNEDNFFNNIKEWIVSICIAIVLVFFIRYFLIGVAIVDGDSMLNTIQDGDRIVYAKILDPEVGDIVLVDTYESKIIKRVIGLEGDRIKIESGKLYINDIEQDEDYIKEEMYEENMEEITVPKGEVFVLGDNRNISRDSRYYGTFDLKEDYKGKVILELFNEFKTY